VSPLLAKLDARSANVVVCGAGYVGLPMAVEFAAAGFSVRALDTDTDRIRALNRGERYVADVPEQSFHDAIAGGKLQGTADPFVLSSADAVVICVPTPLSAGREPDIRHIVAVIDEVVRYQHRDMLVALESTTYPGTTEGVIAPRLGARFELGVDTFLAYSPQRVDPGNATFRPRNTPKIVSGVTPACLDAALRLYRSAIDTLVPVSSPTTAEMVKLFENTFRAVNIGLVNELAMQSGQLGIDAFEVVRAAATKPYGFMPFYPGPGVGGHCIAVDPLYLSWRLAELGQRARFVDLAESINRAMPDHVVERAVTALAARGRSARGSKVLVYGVTYKRDVADTRESPAFAVIQGLLRHGADVTYTDPFVPELVVAGVELRSVNGPDAFSACDLVVVLTDHGALDRPRLLAEAHAVLDARDALAGVPGSRAHVYGL
jgi:UDP-N-acetyl-D-glucosamine dehydrogenase